MQLSLSQEQLKYIIKPAGFVCDGNLGNLKYIRKGKPVLLELSKSKSHTLHLSSFYTEARLATCHHEGNKLDCSWSAMDVDTRPFQRTRSAENRVKRVDPAKDFHVELQSVGLLSLLDITQVMN